MQFESFGRRKKKRFCFLFYFRALASSAPIWQFPGMVPCGDFYKTVTQDFAKSGINCDANIRKSWKAVNNVSSSGKLLSEISKHPFSSTQLRVVGVLEPFPAVIGSEVWLHPGHVTTLSQGCHTERDGYLHTYSHLQSI